MFNDNVMAFLPAGHPEHVNRSERAELGLDLHVCSNAARLVRRELEADGVFHPCRMVSQIGDGFPHQLLRLFDLL